MVQSAGYVHLLKGKGEQRVFVNGRFGFSMNAAKEQLSAAQTVLEKEKAGIACMPQVCRVLPIAEMVG